MLLLGNLFLFKSLKKIPTQIIQTLKIHWCTEKSRGRSSFRYVFITLAHFFQQYFLRPALFRVMGFVLYLASLMVAVTVNFLKNLKKKVFTEFVIILLLFFGCKTQWGLICSLARDQTHTFYIGR